MCAFLAHTYTHTHLRLLLSTDCAVVVVVVVVNEEKCWSFVLLLNLVHFTG